MKSFFFVFFVFADRLDGFVMKKHSDSPQRLEDYLQMEDEFETREAEPGKKRVI